MDSLDIALASISFLTLKDKILLKKNIDSLDRLVVLSIEDISQIVGRSIKRALWNGRETFVQVQKSLRLMEAQHIDAILHDDSRYPALLREILNPPYALFVRGNGQVLEKNCLSIVGTRKICREAALAAEALACEAARDAVVVVSGNAVGVDFFAHKGALASGCKAATVAVLPCGIDTIVPASHKKLVERIIQTAGAVMSEYIPGCPAEPWRFVQRNRIIAALSPTTVVMQAPAGSGALITASLALDYNRDVVFHASAFCEEARRTDEAVRAALQKTKGKERKLRQTAERYVAEGAPVIKNYAELTAFQTAMPGSYSAGGFEV